MFSRKMFIFIGVALFVAINFTVITMSSRESLSIPGFERINIFFISPFQKVITNTLNFTDNIWKTYFVTVLAVDENRQLRKKLAKAVQNQNKFEELRLENSRLKKFVNFTGSVHDTYVAAQVIARDPSPWFKTIVVDKGANDGLIKGSPVLVSEGIVGQTMKVLDNYSKVLLITDRNSAVDALVQNTRVRGIVKGNNTDHCSFKYALRKDEIQVGETIISSGLDQVFPKGLKIGKVLDVKKTHSQLFQDITIETSVNFDKLEEVLVFKNAK
ncbi:MAG: rod shape-determining protein MreC [Desulfobacteraceae bacterium]|nr:rod shape-determining protein MreC [Desulfobacteraceae bacterium]